MKQGIIFDMDGTLWDSADGVAKSWTQVIQNEYKKDMAVTEQDIKRVMGKTMDVIGDIFSRSLLRRNRNLWLENAVTGRMSISAETEENFTRSWRIRLKKTQRTVSSVYRK